MALLVKNVFSIDDSEDMNRQEDRFVMRIDHDSSARGASDSIRYYHDYAMTPSSFASLFMYSYHSVTISYTPNGYLPNPAFNYPPPPVDSQGRSLRESLDVEISPHCSTEGTSRNYQFVGRLIGRAIFDGIPLGITLNPLM